MGNQPCSGDGCLIHILYIIGAITLLISGIIFFLTKRNFKKLKDAAKE
jgi:predicted membrane metal-binding protein